MSKRYVPHVIWVCISTPSLCYMQEVEESLPCAKFTISKLFCCFGQVLLSHAIPWLGHSALDLLEKTKGHCRALFVEYVLRQVSVIRLFWSVYKHCMPCHHQVFFLWHDFVWLCVYNTRVMERFFHLKARILEASVERDTNKTRIQERLSPLNFSISVSSPKDYGGGPFSRSSNVCFRVGMMCFLLRPCCYC